MMQHIHEIPNPPNLINPKLSPTLSAVVLRSIAKDPDARFPTASAMTVALAQALDVPVPSSLSKPKTMSEQPEYNPLQPTRPVSHPPVFTASPPAQFTPVSGGYPQAEVQFNSPAPLTPVEGEERAPLVPPVPPAQPRRPRKGLYIPLIACVLLLLVGISAFFVLPQLFSKNTPANLGGGVVGHITFIHVPNTQGNTFNQLRITLQNIPSAPAGKTYYAWLENPNVEGSDLHWALPVSNGAVDYLTPVDTSHPDLLPRYTRFLVTTEDAGVPPIIPDPGARLYYALLSSTSSSSPTFELKRCPTSGTNPCI